MFDFSLVLWRRACLCWCPRVSLGADGLLSVGGAVMAARGRLGSLAFDGDWGLSVL